MAQDSKRDKSTGHPSKNKAAGRTTSKVQNTIMNNLIGETIGSGRNPRNGAKDGQTAHLLSATQSEERVLATGAYATPG